MKFLEVNMSNSIFKEFCMKKQYTRKQITEAIAYWEKQLKARNYKRVDESVESMARLKMQQVKEKLAASAG